MTKRKYTQRKRAEQQELTRQRIVEATMALHEDLGAARTTVSAVAERAGVQRLTVYRHFPDEVTLLEACTSGWLERHPFPAPEAWADVEDPVARVRTALAAHYAYYGRTRAMWTSSYRDMEVVPALADRMALVEAHLDGVADGLVRGLGARGARRTRARVVVRHGLRFGTWRSLADEGQDDAAAADLVADWLAAVAEP